MAKKKLGEFVSILDAADKAPNTPVPKTLLERFEEEIDWLLETSHREQCYLTSIASQDYIKASEYQHKMMILQYHREFVPRLKEAITGKTLDALMLELMHIIMSPSFDNDRPRSYELAKLDAVREQWKLANRILRTRDKDAMSSVNVNHPLLNF